MLLMLMLYTYLCCNSFFPPFFHVHEHDWLAPCSHAIVQDVSMVSDLISLDLWLSPAVPV